MLIKLIKCGVTISTHTWAVRDIKARECDNFSLYNRLLLNLKPIRWFPILMNEAFEVHFNL
jgi:hypothetical protein